MNFKPIWFHMIIIQEKRLHLDHFVEREERKKKKKKKIKKEKAALPTLACIPMFIG